MRVLREEATTRDLRRLPSFHPHPPVLECRESRCEDRARKQFKDVLYGHNVNAKWSPALFGHLMR